MHLPFNLPNITYYFVVLRTLPKQNKANNLIGLSYLKIEDKGEIIPPAVKSIRRTSVVGCAKKIKIKKNINISEK